MTGAMLWISKQSINIDSFQCVSLHIACKPHSRASSKPKLSHDLISAFKDFSYLSRVVPGCNIAWDGLLFNCLACGYPDEVRVREVKWRPSSSGEK